MKRALLAIAASLGLAVGAISATSTAADARVSVHVGIGLYSGGYPYGYYPYRYQPCCYYPRYVYPAYPRLIYPAPRHLVCYTATKVKIYWRHHKKHRIYVPVRVCSWRYGW